MRPLIPPTARRQADLQRDTPTDGPHSLAAAGKTPLDRHQAGTVSIPIPGPRDLADQHPPPLRAIPSDRVARNAGYAVDRRSLASGIIECE